MTDVFISYARSDQAEAERLAKRLSGLGLTVWYDHGLTPGLDYAREIVGKLHGAAAVIVCWSAAAARSRWVFAEALAGLHRDNLVPVSLEATTAPAPFATLQAIPMQRWAGRARHPGWRALLDRLSALTGKGDLRARDEAYAQGVKPGKALVISFDSAWQGADNASSAVLLRGVVARKDSDQRQQLIRYISGGGFTGYRRTSLAESLIGALDNPSSVLEAYQFLIDNYDPGDRLYIFAAGTGAIAARRLCTMINVSGILQRHFLHMMYDAYRLAMARAKSEEQGREHDEAARMFRAIYSTPIESDDFPEGVAAVAYLGLWDCVAWAGFGRRHLLPTLTVAPNVRAIRLAAALDEARAAFPLSPFTDLEARNTAAGSEGKFREVWFPGRVNDLVGTSGSSLLAEPFLWVLDGAEEAGLDIDRTSEALADIHRMHDEAKATHPPTKGPAALRLLMPSHFELRTRMGPSRLEDVSPGAIERWRANRHYRPAALKRLKRQLDSPPVAVSDE